MTDVVMIVIRSVITVTLFCLFVALIGWAYSPKRRKEFDDAANLVFDDEADPSAQRERA